MKPLSWKVISKNTILVNLDALPKLPFDGAEIECQTGSGWVKVEKREDGLLYVDGCKVILYLSERQKNDQVIKGHELRNELSGKPVLHPNILDALLANPHLIPEDWKDENGKNPCIFFWAVIFRHPNDKQLCVRCFYFLEGQWPRDYARWLIKDWPGAGPAALLTNQS